MPHYAAPCAGPVSTPELMEEYPLVLTTGKRSFDTWDEYLAQLEEIGLEKYLEVAQTAYDRQH